MKTAKRIDRLPPYLFAELDRKVAEKRAQGVDVISFGVGDPDRPTPAHIVEAAAEGLRDSSTHQYPSYYGSPELREAVARYYDRRFGVSLDPSKQVLILIGSKEGIAHLATAFVDPGDTVLVPDPGYPVYETSTILAGGTSVPVPLHRENGFLPRLDTLPDESRTDARLFWMNYPSNPTAAVCEPALFEQAVAFAARNDLLLAHDAAYLEIGYDGYRAPSVLQAPGALEHAIEFGSLSKTYNMTGWRVGWVAGAETAIEALGRVKTNIDSGAFNALQRAGVAALDGPQDSLAETLVVYQRRRDLLVEALRSAGFEIDPPRGSIYLWVPVPEGDTSVSFSEFLLDTAGVVVAPGSGYGKLGEGFVRFSLTLSDDRLEQGVERVAKALADR